MITHSNSQKLDQGPNLGPHGPTLGLHSIDITNRLCYLVWWGARKAMTISLIVRTASKSPHHRRSHPPTTALERFGLQNAFRDSVLTYVAAFSAYDAINFHQTVQLYHSSRWFTSCLWTGGRCPEHFCRGVQNFCFIEDHLQICR